MIKLKLIFLIIILFLLSLKSYAEVRIIYKIDDKIITNLDILEERKYVLFLRPNLAQLSNDEIIKFSKNSIIRELIKKNELDKVFKNIDEDLLKEKIKLRLFKFMKISNDEEAIKYLSNKKLDYSKLLDKLKYESLWNEYIFQKYRKLVKIDKENLRNNLRKKISNNKKFEYNLSELLFDLSQDENLKNKYKEIIENTEKNGFGNSVLKFSISDSFKNEGNIGWIKETMLSSKVIEIIKKMNVGDISAPLKYPNGYLLLKINNKRTINEKIDIDKELNELIKYEENIQLQQFSLLLYKRLKQNTSIYEY